MKFAPGNSRDKINPFFAPSIIHFGVNSYGYEYIRMKFKYFISHLAFAKILLAFMEIQTGRLDEF